MQIFRKSLLLTAALALTAFAACSNDDNENGGDGKETDPDYLALPHAYGTYYHTYWGDAAGDYYLVLTDADLDQADAAPYKYRLDIDFLSVLATDPKKRASAGRRIHHRKIHRQQGRRIHRGISRNRFLRHAGSVRHLLERA